MVRRLYLGPDQDLFCLIDDEDFEWAKHWRWGFVPNSRKKKFYASRSTRLHGQGGPQTRIYLHKAILIERKGLEPPSPEHTIGDHDNGNSLDNRRDNLFWRTVSQNNRNRFGLFYRQRQAALAQEIAPVEAGALEEIPF